MRRKIGVDIMDNEKICNAYNLVGIIDNKNVWYNNNTGIITLSSKDIEKKELLESYTSLFPKANTDLKSNHRKIKIDGLIINVAEACNMKCTYCFANEGTYDNIHGGIMSYENLCVLINKVFDIYPKGTSGICFFGGEPLLAFSEIKKFIPYVIDLYNKKQLPLPVFSINTNGTLLNEEIISFINKFHISVTVSIDGDKENHDRMRIFKDGTGTYDTIKENLLRIKDKKFVLFCESTITEEYMMSYKKNDIRSYVNNLYTLGFDNYALFTVDYSDTKKMDLSLYKSKIEEIYSDLIEYTFEQLLSEDNWIKATTQLVASIEGIVKHKMRFSTVNMEIYPCQMYYQAKKGRFCSVTEDELNERIDSFIPACRFNINECKECIAYRICSLWCGGASLLFGGSAQSVVESRCVAQRKIVEQIILHLVKIRKSEESYKRLVHNLKNFSNIYSSDALLSNKIYEKFEENNNGFRG